MLFMVSPAVATREIECFEVVRRQVIGLGEEILRRTWRVKEPSGLFFVCHDGRILPVEYRHNWVIVDIPDTTPPISRKLTAMAAAWPSLCGGKI